MVVAIAVTLRIPAQGILSVIGIFRQSSSVDALYSFRLCRLHTSCPQCSVSELALMVCTPQRVSAHMCLA